MKRIAFIIPYFGKFNNYFNLWLESCRNNPTVDWFILTDNKDNFDFPENVHKIATTLEQVRQHFSSVFGFEVALAKPYKLCDMKPSYVYVFQDLVKDYDFCGWCDVDLIWGNIRSFLADEVLDNYDMISRWGHCTLIRNTKEMRKLFMTTPPGILTINCQTIRKLSHPTIYTYSMRPHSCCMQCMPGCEYSASKRHTTIAA